MAKKHYMALDDVQELWTNKIKPTLPTKQDVAGMYGVTVVGTNLIFAPNSNISVSGTNLIFTTV